MPTLATMKPSRRWGTQSWATRPLPPARPPADQAPPPADSDPINNQTATSELRSIRRGEGWLIGVGIATLIVNSIIACIYLGQLEQMRRATEASTHAVEVADQNLDISMDQFDRAQQQTITQTWSSIKAANAAKSAADTARDALHVAERAYVVTGTATFDTAKETVTIPIFNTGHIPAKGMIMKIHSILFEAVPPTPRNQAPGIEMFWNTFNRDSVVPGVPAPITAVFTRMSQQGMEAGEQEFVIAGSIAYNDGFGKKPNQLWFFCARSEYNSILKETTSITCVPNEWIPILEKADGYPNKMGIHQYR